MRDGPECFMAPLNIKLEWKSRWRNYRDNSIAFFFFSPIFDISKYVGCVEVVGCVRCEELASWEVVPEGVSYLLP